MIFLIYCEIKNEKENICHFFSYRIGAFTFIFMLFFFMFSVRLQFQKLYNKLKAKIRISFVRIENPKNHCQQTSGNKENNTNLIRMVSD